MNKRKHSFSEADENPAQVAKTEDSPTMDQATNVALELSQNMGLMKMINWQGSRLISGVELRTVLHELKEDLYMPTQPKLITMPDLTRNQNKFVVDCATAEGLVIEEKYRSLKISREGIKLPMRTSRDSFSSIRISEIIDDFLYLGGARDLVDPAVLSSRNIKRVVNCAKEYTEPVKGENIETHTTCWADSKAQNIETEFDAAFRFIEDAKELGERVFVHCMLGKSRSASLVIAYLMREHKQTLKEAFEFVRSRRTIIKPNSGFMQQLIEYEQQLHGSNSMTMDHYFYIYKKEVHVINVPVEDKETVVEEFCQTHFNGTFYSRMFDIIFKDVIPEQKDVGHFIMNVSMTVNRDKELMSELMKKNLQTFHVSKQLATGAKDFFRMKVT